MTAPEETPDWIYMKSEVPPPGLYMVAFSSTGKSGLFVLALRMQYARDWTPKQIPTTGSIATIYAYRPLSAREHIGYAAGLPIKLFRPDAPPPAA